MKIYEKPLNKVVELEDVEIICVSIPQKAKMQSYEDDEDPFGSSKFWK